MNTDWSTKTEWMREVGAEEASFSESGVLLSVKLAPALPPDDGEQSQSESPAEARQRLEDERRRRVFGAVGGLVKRRGPNE